MSLSVLETIELFIFQRQQFTWSSTVAPPKFLVFWHAFIVVKSMKFRFLTLLWTSGHTVDGRALGVLRPGVWLVIKEACSWSGWSTVSMYDVTNILAIQLLR